MLTEAALLHNDPAPITSAKLLLLAAVSPMMTVFPRNAPTTCAPLLITNRLNAPLLPTVSVEPICQRAVGLMSRTSLDLAVALRPITLRMELISDALSDSSSKVNEPFAPTVTSPVMLLVTLGQRDGRAVGDELGAQWSDGEQSHKQDAKPG
jgi:hypothetical protein